MEQGDNLLMSNIYDHDGALRRMGNDAELFAEMVGLLRSDAPHWLTVLKRAIDDGDPAQIQRAAHTLKGLAANFGAERAVGLAADIERRAKTQQLEGLTGAAQELEESLDELIAALAAVPEPTPGILPSLT
jgi:HPt (histidine-containing phosphotransfer) domain-containing protein